MTTFAPIDRPASIDAVRLVLSANGVDLPLSAPQFGEVRVDVPAGLTIELDGERLPVSADDVRFALGEAGFVVDPTGDDVVLVRCAQQTVAPVDMVAGETRIMWLGRPTLVARVELLDGGSAVVHLVTGAGVRCRAAEGFTLAAPVDAQ